MKRTAFLQALLIVILLLLSWALFLTRGNRHQPAPVTVEPDQVESEPGIPDEDVIPDNTGNTGLIDGIGTIENVESIPPLWEEWMAYLQQQQTATDMRIALNLMRDALFSMDKQDALARLLELIFSRVNIRTGLAFQVGEGGKLTGAGDLQTLLLDWLAQLDPARAASLGRLAIESAGTNLGQDLFVVHLRNVAWGSGSGSTESADFIRNAFGMLLDNENWISSPTRSIAEAMDFAVYLGDAGLIDRLADFMEPGSVPALGHASSIAIERLVDNQPLESGRALIETIGNPGISPVARAGFLARLDPMDNAERQIIDEYLGNSKLLKSEAEAFFQYLPNLNLTLSYNLVSPEISITNTDDHVVRLKGALEAIQQWQADPSLQSLSAIMEQTRLRLLQQLGIDAD